MILNRAASFFDPEAIWNLLETQAIDSHTDLLAEHHVKRYGSSDLYLGMVIATGERALWLKFPGRHREPFSLAHLQDMLWVKTIEYPDHSLLTIVLTDPDAASAFSEFARALLDALAHSSTTPAAHTLCKLLRNWPPQFVAPLRYAA